MKRKEDVLMKVWYSQPWSWAGLVLAACERVVKWRKRALKAERQLEELRQWTIERTRRTVRQSVTLSGYSALDAEGLADWAARDRRAELYEEERE